MSSITGNFFYFRLVLKHLKQASFIDLMKDGDATYIQETIEFIKDRFGVYLVEIEDYLDTLYEEYVRQKRNIKKNKFLDDDMIWHDVWTNIKLNSSKEYEIKLYEILLSQKKEIESCFINLLDFDKVQVGVCNKTEDCAVCFDDMKGKKSITCPNKHTFHEECLKKWFAKSKKRDCPLCREQI